MAEIVVKAEKRTELGKGPNRRLRANRRIPAVLYGHGIETVPVSVNPSEILKILTSDTGRNTIFRLSVDGRETDVLIREYQLHPVKGNLIHVDFQRVAMDETMVFEVPVELVGVSKGVKGGGILEHPQRVVEIECLPRDVPQEITVDISDLDVGDSVRVRDLALDRTKLRVLTDPDTVIVAILAPKAELEVEEAPEEEAAEPEVLRKGKAETEESEE